VPSLLMSRCVGLMARPRAAKASCSASVPSSAISRSVRPPLKRGWQSTQRTTNVWG
jgi:hypothetical protein